MDLWYVFKTWYFSPPTCCDGWCGVCICMCLCGCVCGEKEPIVMFGLHLILAHTSICFNGARAIDRDRDHIYLIPHSVEYKCENEAKNKNKNVAIELTGEKRMNQNERCTILIQLNLDDAKLSIFLLLIVESWCCVLPFTFRWKRMFHVCDKARTVNLWLHVC